MRNCEMLGHYLLWMRAMLGACARLLCKMQPYLGHYENQGSVGSPDELTRAKAVRADGIIGTAGGVGGLRQQPKHGLIFLNSNHSWCLHK